MKVQLPNRLILRRLILPKLLRKFHHDIILLGRITVIIRPPFHRGIRQKGVPFFVKHNPIPLKQVIQERIANPMRPKPMFQKRGSFEGNDHDFIILAPVNVGQFLDGKRLLIAFGILMRSLAQKIFPLETVTHKMTNMIKIAREGSNESDTTFFPLKKISHNFFRLEPLLKVRIIFVKLVFYDDVV
ncbi:MAG: hypothetical protein ACTTKW_04280 [Schwartzia sp. (in: firmicutes)]